jgi:hypothetical protein
LTSGQREFKWVFFESVLVCREAPQLDDQCVTHLELQRELAQMLKLEDHQNPDMLCGILLLQGDEFEFTTFPENRDPPGFREKLLTFLKDDLKIDRPVELEWKFDFE